MIKQCKTMIKVELFNLKLLLPLSDSGENATIFFFFKDHFKELFSKLMGP